MQQSITKVQSTYCKNTNNTATIQQTYQTKIKIEQTYNINTKQNKQHKYNKHIATIQSNRAKYNKHIQYMQQIQHDSF